MIGYINTFFFYRKPKHLKNNLPWPSIYHLFGIGGPVMLVIILVIAHSMEHSDIHPGFGVVKCWFQCTASKNILLNFLIMSL